MENTRIEMVARKINWLRRRRRRRDLACCLGEGEGVRVTARCTFVRIQYSPDGLIRLPKILIQAMVNCNMAIHLRTYGDLSALSGRYGNGKPGLYRQRNHLSGEHSIRDSPDQSAQVSSLCTILGYAQYWRSLRSTRRYLCEGPAFVRAFGQ